MNLKTQGCYNHFMRAIDIAEYVVCYADRKGHPVNLWELHKILYILWATWYEKTGEYLFSDEVFYAMVTGPVVQSVWYRFCTFGSMTILPVIAGISPECPDAYRGFVEKVTDRILEKSHFWLREATMKEGFAWSLCYEENKSNVIPYSLIIEKDISSIKQFIIC